MEQSKEEKKPTDVVGYLKGLDIEALSLFIIDKSREAANHQQSINIISQALEVAGKILDEKRAAKKQAEALKSIKIPEEKSNVTN